MKDNMISIDLVRERLKQLVFEGKISINSARYVLNEKPLENEFVPLTSKV